MPLENLQADEREYQIGRKKGINDCYRYDRSTQSKSQ